MCCGVEVFCLYADVVMSVLFYSVSRVSLQYIDQMLRTEVLPSTINAGQCFLCGEGSIPNFWRVMTDIAVAIRGISHGFTKIIE